MGWHGMRWDGMGCDGMGWDGMGWDGMGWDRMGCVGEGIGSHHSLGSKGAPGLGTGWSVSL